MKIRADSLWAKLSEEQRDQLMLGLVHGSLTVEEAAALCSGWVGRRVPAQRVSKAYSRHVGAWKLQRARAAATELEAVAPDDLDAATRRALGQRRFTIALEDLDALQLAALERNEIARERLRLDIRVARRDIALDRSRLLLERARGGETGADLQTQIDLALAEIDRLKTGEADA